jgi:Cytochrome C'
MYRKLLVTSLIGAGLAIPTVIYAQNDEWRQKMDDAQDAKDELMEAVKDKSGPKAAEETAKITKLLQETKAFWAEQKMADIVKLADDNIAASNDMAKIAASGKMDTAKTAFDKINTTCSACHDIHPENRLKK